MKNADVVPRLIFFRRTPDDLTSRPPLASSLQNQETCFYLLGLRRYPPALISCAAAIESVLQAGLNIPPAGRTPPHAKLVDWAFSRYPKIVRSHRRGRAFDEEELRNFRRKRDRI